MIVILDLLGSLDLHSTTNRHSFFFSSFSRTNQKNVDTAEIFLVNLSPANSENQQPSKATIQQIIHWSISHFL
jgi:hypothetical protein